MSYAIIRNEKLTRAEAQGRCVHNDRRAKNHSNKDIDVTRTSLNYYLKKNELNYVKEFDKLKNENDLKGQIRSNSIIMCEMIFTSDDNFFKEIGEERTKEYFKESYKFVCNYKNLGEKNIISAVVHIDEGVPHMHLVFVPVVHTKDKEGKEIDKICSRDFWKGKDSYRNLQNAYYDYISSKGFALERGLPSEETGRLHQTLEQYKKLTNFENTKQVLKDITLELPQVPDIKSIRKMMINRDEKIENQIIKPKDELIKKLYNENISLHKELSKQANIVDTASTLQKQQEKMLEENKNLKIRCNKLEESLEHKERDLKTKYDDEVYDLHCEYGKIIKELENENKYLNKVIDRFKVTVKKFIKWICNKFSCASEDEIIRDFERETYTNFNYEKGFNIKQSEKKDRGYER